MTEDGTSLLMANSTLKLKKFPTVYFMEDIEKASTLEDTTVNKAEEYWARAQKRAGFNKANTIVLRFTPAANIEDMFLVKVNSKNSLEWRNKLNQVITNAKALTDNEKETFLFNKYQLQGQLL